MYVHKSVCWKVTYNTNLKVICANFEFLNPIIKRIEAKKYQMHKINLVKH